MTDPDNLTPADEASIEAVAATVSDLLVIHTASTVKLLDAMAALFDQQEHEWFTGGMVAAIIRDCATPLR